MTLQLHQKITVAEAQAWLTAQTEAIFSKLGNDSPSTEFLTDEFLMDTRPKDFKYRKPRVSKKSSGSESERSEEDYDDSRCDARVWCGGFGAQCTRKKDAGFRCCKTHQKAVDQFGIPKEGFINEDRPDYHFGDESKPFMNWKDSAVEKPTKTTKSTSGKPRSPSKCSVCGELGHNKRKCSENPANTVVDNTVDTTSSNNTVVKEVVDVMVNQVVDQLDTDISLTDSQETAAGTGLTGETTEETTEETTVETTEETAEERTTCLLDGITYYYKANMVVYDEDDDEVGTFENAAIAFDKASAKMHTMKVAAL